MKHKININEQLIFYFNTAIQFVYMNTLFFIFFGVLVGTGAAFSGLGGGFLVVPLLLFMGYSSQKAVGTAFLTIFIISLSALIAHGKLAHIDYKTGVLIGLGGIVGAQIGALLIEQVSTEMFKKIFAVILVGLGMYLFIRK